MLPISKSLLFFSLVNSTCRRSHVAPIIEAPPSIKIVKNSYIVQFEAPPPINCEKLTNVDQALPIECGNKEKVKKNHHDFMQAMDASEVKLEIRNTMDTLFNGISITVNSPSDIKKIANFPNVKAIWPLATMSLPKGIHQGTEKLPFSHILTGVTSVHNSMKLNGEGIKVGIIDSGIDYTHPALGGCFGVGCKVAFGYDFVGDAFDGENNEIPDEDPMDCTGHGTHIAGIVGAKDKDFVGVAPEVTLGAYKVNGCEEGTRMDILINALEKAYEDQMDVINVSIGERNGWPKSPFAAAASDLAAKGTIVIASIGNDGDLGLLQPDAPGVGENVIGVASFDNSYHRTRYFKETQSGDHEISFSESDSVREEKEKLAELAYSSDNNDGCEDFPVNFFREKTALIQSGNCNLYEKSKNAQAGGAKSVIIFNNIPNSYLDLSDICEGINIPFMGVSLEDGQYLLKKVISGQKITLEVHDHKTFPFPTSGKISEFSSWGLSADLKIKPDIGAPGGFIYSTFPIAKGSYATKSGTSTATPYIAGVTALYLQHYMKTKFEMHGKLKFDDLRTVLQNTAIPATEPGFDNYRTSVARQGAGLVQAERAIQHDFIVTPSSLSLGLKSSATQNFSIKNLAEKDGRDFEISHEFSVAANVADLNKPVLESYPAEVTIIGKNDQKQATSISPKVYVNAGGSEEFKVSISPNPNFKPTDHYVYGGYIFVTALDNKGKPTEKVASIPFSGYSGDFLARPFIDKKGENPPRISLIKKTNAENEVESESKEKEFHFDKGDTLLLELMLLLPCREVNIHLYNSKDGKYLGLLESVPYYPRNVPDDHPNSFLWEGSMRGGEKVPPGIYRIQISALKPIADPQKSSSYDIWDSEPFSIL